MPEDDPEGYDRELSWLNGEDPEQYAAKSKGRRIKLLEAQLDDVKEDLKDRVELHKSLEKEFEREKDFKERKLDRVRKFGSSKGKDKRKRELRNDIENLKKEQWRERVKVWRDSQDLLREARKLNRNLTDLKLRLGDLKDYFESDR